MKKMKIIEERSDAMKAVDRMNLREIAEWRFFFLLIFLGSLAYIGYCIYRGFTTKPLQWCHGAWPVAILGVQLGYFAWKDTKRETTQ